MGLRVLSLFKPFMALLPDIAPPDRKVPFYERIVYTGVALLAYMVMSQLPLYGIKSSDSSDPLYWLRTVLASNRGTLTELGVLPILTSGMIIQFLAAANFFRVDFSLRQDRALFSGAQKLFAILIAASQAILLVLAGHYGNPSDIGTVGSALLVLQLVSSSVVILLLDELLQKGYGLGSGINIFIAASVSQNVFWKLLSFSSVATYRGNEYEGAIVSVFHLLGSRSSKIRALKDAFYRPDLPNAMSAIATIAMFAFTTYLLGFRVELSVKSNRMRSQRASYPIRLFYTSAMPVILQSALYANVLLVSYLLYTYFENNFLVHVLGVWGTFDDSGLLAPVGGIAYYLSAPHGLIDAIFHPIHTLLYAALTIITCAYLSKLWTDISGCSSRDVAKKLKDQQVTIAGYRDISMYKELNRVILPAASVGGATLALMSTTADILGCIGTGSGILISVLVIFEFFEMFAREQMEGNLSMDNMMSVQ
ncbi:Putative Preprotein translocase, SecY subunit [Rhizopus microsporus]|nr:Putative Preprotein translocase, SecY subunit [Rhizopus microsporus]